MILLLWVVWFDYGQQFDECWVLVILVFCGVGDDRYFEVVCGEMDSIGWVVIVGIGDFFKIVNGGVGILVIYDIMIGVVGLNQWGILFNVIGIIFFNKGGVFEVVCGEMDSIGWVVIAGIVTGKQNTPQIQPNNTNHNVIKIGRAHV